MDTQAPADRPVEEISSLCMNCHEEGTTRLLLTKIPFFREVVLMSFSCPHCEFKNSEVQSAGEVQQRGVKISFKAGSQDDLQRQIVKSDTCVARLEELDLEIPAGRGQLTNIEGLLSMIKTDLEAQQPARKEATPEIHRRVQAIIQLLADMRSAQKMPLTITLDDIAGNSSLEPSPEDRSGKYIRSEYARTSEQNETLGLRQSAAEPEASSTVESPEYRASDQMYPVMPASNGIEGNAPQDANDEIVENQVYSFPASCPGCEHPCNTHMKMVRVPHFKEVVIMSTVCDSCGYRSNEVKTGGEVPAKGRRITLRVEKKEDLSRDILKAESAVVSCPELSLNVEPGTLGGRFTTVEGLLVQVRHDLKASIFETNDDGSMQGDSMPSNDRTKWDAFFKNLDSAISGQIAFTLILEDPLAASYVQSFTAPDPDAQLRVLEYERTQQEEEDLGLADMRTEGYEEPDATNGASKDAIVDSGNQQPVEVDEIQKQVEARMKELEADDTHENRS
ncbi:MAG: nucleolar zinc-finger protein [Chrysothrix sp. TS-e1954]|nr:MAG: nucleolar zinc-finger protein [Chrysothrix sp. TS-e1954]